MKLVSRLLVAFALFGCSSLALATPDDDDHHRRGHSHHQRDHDRHERHDRDDHRGEHHRGRNDHHYSYRHVEPRYVTRHHHRWSRGHRYTGSRYVVRNYGYYRLRPPPRGYHWVRADNDYLLVAIATGIILDIALR